MHAALLIGISISSLVLSSSSVALGRTEIYRDKYVIAEVETPSILKGNLHGDEIFYLKAFGRTYKWVQGSKPFYIDVPTLSSIAFVTGERQEHSTLHVVNTQTKKETAVLLEGLSFGLEIGYEQYGRKRGEPFTESIDASEDKLILTTWGRRDKVTATVSLNSNSVERTESTTYDADGHVKSRFIEDKSGNTWEHFDANGQLTDRQRWVDGKRGPIKGRVKEVFDADGHVKERWVDGNRVQ